MTVLDSCTTRFDACASRSTGKERDSESGLDNFGARYYASTMGQWMSPDPSGLFFANPADPQSLNLYSYARNNPLKNIDPTGLDCVYFNDAGTGVESIDHHSNSIECGKSGGDWVNGTTSEKQVTYNSKDETFTINSSDTWHNYTSTVRAPGEAPDGTSCEGNCSTANGYSSSLKWPSFTLQLGLAANGSFWGPLTGGAFVGMAVDSHLHVAGYSGYGGGVGVGSGASVGVQLGYSNGRDVCALGGPFANATATGGTGIAGTYDVFGGEGDGPGGMVTGGAITLGGGGGAGASVTATNTTMTPFGAHKCK